MFGTLVIQLPSNYSGGQLIVYHQSKSMEFDFGGPIGCTDIHYAAFYADCQHEIKPVTEGYRLCLVYNLVYRGSGGCPAPADNQKVVSALLSSIKKWGKDLKEGPPMMAYMLEHKYCEASLSFQSLKNSDRAVADVLTQAKQEVEFDLYVAMVNVVQSWSASYDNYYHCDNYSEDELLDESVTVENLKSRDGQSMISDINLDKDYFVPKDFFDTIDPDNKEFEATGNEGATIDKQYNRAALLLWPSEFRTINLGFKNVIRSLSKDVRNLPNISEEKKAELEEIAKDLVRACVSPHHGHGVSGKSYMSFLQVLQAFGKAELISEFLNTNSSSFHSSLVEHPSFSDKILAIGLKYGWDMLRSPLQAIFNEMPSSDYTTNKYGQFLCKISQQLTSEVQKDVCRGLASIAVGVLFTQQATRSYFTPPVDSEISFLRSLQNLDDVELISKFFSGFASSSYPVRLIESPSFGDEVCTIGSKYGWDMFRNPLITLFNKIQSPHSTEKCNQFLNRISKQPLSEVQKNVCLEVANVAIKTVSNEQDTRRSSANSYVSLLQSLQNLGEVALISKLLDGIASCPVHVSLIESPSFSSEIVAVGSKYGWDILKQPLQVIFSKIPTVEKCIQFLHKISQKPASKDQKSVCHGLSCSILRVLSGEKDTKAHSSSRGAKFLLLLFRTLTCDHQLLIQVLTARPNRYPVLDTLVPVCEALHKSLKEGKRAGEALKQLLSHCISSLEASSSRAIPCPSHWSEMVALACSCDDCQGLIQFLRHQTEKQRRFKMGKGRRDHLQHQLRDHKCAVTISTECYGNPHALVVTKTRETYQRDCQRVEREKGILSRLRALNGESSSADEPAAKQPKVVAVDLTEM